MKRLLLAMFIFTAAIAAISGQQPVVAVNDFKVESDKSDWKYLGKGISRLVASELRKSGRVQLVEREEMNRILTEQELSLSALSDEGNQVRIGHLLSATHIVMGEIIDMGPVGLLVSMRMASVMTGEIVWQSEKQDKLAAYDYLGAYFAKSLLATLGVDAGKATLIKIARKVEKEPEAIISASKGIDAYDRRDTEAARAELERARAIDPANDVAAEYLAKLVVNTAKFKMMLEPYYPDQNPAYLGIIKTDRFFFSSNESLQTFYTIGRKPPAPVVTLSNGNELLEWDYRVKSGYAFPLGSSLGFSAEAIYSGTFNELRGYSPWANTSSKQTGAGGIFGGGLRLNDFLSLGFALGVYAESNTNVMFFVNYEDTIHPAFSYDAGLLYHNRDESLVFDAQMGWCTGRIELLDPNTVKAERYVAMPLFIEATLTRALNQKKTFLIVKQLDDIFLDQDSYFGQIIPAVEHFLFPWLSLRLGAELAYARLDGGNNFGYGGQGGLTFRDVGKGLDVDLNICYRMRPSRVITGLLYPEWVIAITSSWNNLYLSRRR